MKKYTLHTVVLFVILFFPLTVRAYQTNLVIDSLQKASSQAKNDSVKILILTKIALEFKFDEPDSMSAYTERAVRIAEKSNSIWGKGRAYQALASCYHVKSESEKSLEYYLKAQQFFDRSTDSRSTAFNLVLTGQEMNTLGRSNEALTYVMKGLRLAEKVKEDEVTGTAYTVLGDIYENQANEDAAILNYKKSIPFLTRSDGDIRLISAYNNIGTVFEHQQKIDSAIHYYEKALVISKKLNYELANTTILNNIGSAYNRIGEYEKAMKYTNEGLEIARRLKNETRIMASEGGLANIYSLMGKNDLALASYFKLLKFYQRTNSPYDVAVAYFNISDSYNRMGDFKKALYYRKLHTELNDSLVNINKLQEIIEKDALYDNEKREMELKRLQTESELKAIEFEEKISTKNSNERKTKLFNLLLIFLGIVLILLGFMAIMILKSLSQKRVSNKILSEKNAQIERANRDLQVAGKELETQKKIIEDKTGEVIASINYARRIQEAILPSQNYIQKYQKEFFVLYQPKDIVAGDFYWFQHNEKSSISLFAVCDCTGHGVPGAMVSVVAHNALQRAVNEFGLIKPASILDKVNELIEETFSSDTNDVKDGMDISLCAYNAKSGILEWSGANNPLWIVKTSKNEVLELKADKQPIGKFDHRKPFTNHQIQLEKNDTLYLFSDGYADQFGGKDGKKYKYSRFKEYLMEISVRTITDQKKFLKENFEYWKGDLEQLDDVCVMGVRV